MLRALSASRDSTGISTSAFLHAARQCGQQTSGSASKYTCVGNPHVGQVDTEAASWFIKSLPVGVAIRSLLPDRPQNDSGPKLHGCDGDVFGAT